MPIVIYPRENPRERVAWLCDGDWRLPMQIYELEEWLKSEGKNLPQGEYVADVGFQWCRDAGGGGSALSPESMKIMGELGISLFLSEYPGFSDEIEEPNKALQPTPGSVTPRATEGTSK